MLTDLQQERYSRHLLLDNLGGAGQERLVAAGVWISLPAEASVPARWCARYLAASGVGTLWLEGPWAEAAAEECRALGPETVLLPGPPAPSQRPALRIALFGNGAAPPATSPTGPAVLLLGPGASPGLGTAAADEAIKRLAGAGQPAPAPLDSPSIPA